MRKTYVDEKGYLRFNDTHKLVHRWVAYNNIYKSHFYFYPFSAYIVHHKDRNKQNNSVDNLELLAPNEHREIHGLPPNEHREFNGLPSKNCFIATAAYGTPFQEEVQILRDWRDNYLRKNELGNFFINFYYWFSPPIANIIRDNDNLRKLIRAFLNPIVNFLKIWSR